MHSTAFAGGQPHPSLTIDDIPLDVWLKRCLPDQDVLDLVPAQLWMSDKDDLALAWRRIRDEGLVNVPLLICPDDLDFVCSVVLVEQETTAAHVIWRRFGMDRSRFTEPVGTSAAWFLDCGPLMFERAAFGLALDEFRRLADHVGP
jgi:hypothetical protein